MKLCISGCFSSFVFLVLLMGIAGGCHKPGQAPQSHDAATQQVATGGTVSKVGSIAEWLRPKEIMVHTPDEEVFVGVVHPAAALFERPFSLLGARREHDNFVSLLQREGARVNRLRDVLLMGTLDAEGGVINGKALTDLQNFSQKFLKYKTDGLPGDMVAKQESYRESSIRALHPHELVKIILQQPTVTLTSTDGHNTGYSASYALNPVMNMYFMRDQVITTAKGVVLGHFNAVQREVETVIAEFAYAKIGVKPIFSVSGDARLEGGDFIPAGDTAFLGRGLRTNAEAVRQLLEAGVFGTQRVVIVNESWHSQDQMHLDTYFNILGEKLAVLVDDRMNVRGSDGTVVSGVDPQKRLTVDVYELESGRYVKRVSEADFQEYMENTLGYRLVPVSNDDQLKYGINFLTVGEKKILGVDGVSRDYKDRLAAVGIQAQWMDFHNLTGGYGAAHCTTQVLLRQ